MGFFKGIAQGFGCVGHGCGFIVGIVIFLVVLGIVLRACGVA